MDLPHIFPTAPEAANRVILDFQDDIFEVAARTAEGVGLHWRTSALAAQLTDPELYKANEAKYEACKDVAKAIRMLKGTIQPRSTDDAR